MTRNLAKRGRRHLPQRLRIAPTIALLGIGAAAAVAGAGLATPPAKNGLIAFQRYLFQDHPLQADIFVANADGSGERRITRAPLGRIDGEPDWSADGKRIVFQRGPSVDGPWTLWTVNADGGGARRLSPARGRCLDESSPSFSPDGAQIAFECHRHTSHGELFSIVVMDSNGGNRRVVVPGSKLAGTGRPQFSPDGKRLVFEHQNIEAKPKNGHATFVVNLDGTDLRRVTPWRLRAGDHPDWSPDGTLILVRSNANGPDFYRQGKLFVVRPDGTGLRRLTSFGARVQLLQNGSFSPDGKSVVFATTARATSTRKANLPDVFTMSLGGSRMRPVTREKNWDGSPDWGNK
jgi:Tol biopolymer transport system component